MVVTGRSDISVLQVTSEQGCWTICDNVANCNVAVYTITGDLAECKLKETVSPNARLTDNSATYFKTRSLETEQETI